MKSPNFWITAAIIVIALLAAIPPVARYIEISTYYRLQRSTGDRMETLSTRRPSDVSAGAWEAATDWTKIAYDNVFFSPDHASLSELQTFRAELEAKLKGKVDRRTLDWIWHRLARTGPHGKKYVARFEPVYHRDSSVALSRSSTHP